MKKKMIAVCLSALLALAVVPAQADITQDLLEGFGLTSRDIEQLSGILSTLDEGTSREVILALVNGMLNEAAEGALPGVLEGDLYSHPRGFTLRVPAGWTLSEQALGASAMLSSAPNANGFSDTISVLALTAEVPDFSAMTREKVDTLFAGTLPGYRLLSLDPLTYQDVPAYTLSLTHGADAQAALFQRMLLFNKEGAAFLITLTTQNDDASRAAAESVYTTFIETFTVATGDGVG